MDFDDRQIREAVARTEVIRAPKQNLFTFGTTNIYYYLVTEPAATPLPRDGDETVVREGRVIAQKPQIVTPYYLTSLEGFGESARRYFDFLVRKYGRDAPGLFYTYRNEPKETNVVSSNLLSVIEKIKTDLEQRGDPLTALIKGVDELWDVALVRFIFELTSRSVGDHISQMNERGLLNTDSRGVPNGARANIEEMFRQVRAGERDPRELKTEIDRWGLFAEYQDRFFALFRK
jgi:hypothetical protein